MSYNLDDVNIGGQLKVGTGIVPAVKEGDEISMFYDPMIAKLCSWGQTREISIKRMESALDNFLLEGIDHNIPFLSAILANKRFKSGDF